MSKFGQELIDSLSEAVDHAKGKANRARVQYVEVPDDEGGYVSNSEAMRAWQVQEHLSAERLNGIRAELAEADADLRPLLSEDDVERHFAGRMKECSKLRGQSAGACRSFRRA